MLGGGAPQRATARACRRAWMTGEPPDNQYPLSRLTTEAHTRHLNSSGVLFHLSEVTGVPITIGSLTARQCEGGQIARAHDRPFLGIECLAQAEYCEVQSTISA
jgi:hypothetical protein